MEPIRASNSTAAARLSWVIRNKGADAEIDLYDVIGDPYEGTSAKDFVQELRGITADRIRLNINSPGGFVDDALAIYDAIQRHPAEITAHITVAASAASFVAMAADKRVISKNGKVQIHDAQGFVGIAARINSESIDEIVTTLLTAKAVLEEESNNIASIYADVAGGTADEWRQRMKANGDVGTIYRGQEAVDAGLVDEVAAPAPRNEVTRVAALAEQSEETAPPIDLSLIPSLARGYTPPIPDFTRLVAANLPASKKEPRNG